MTTLNVDQSDWGQVVVTGADRIRFMQGMCTANIDALGPGDWTRAAVLNVKGRLVSVVDVAAREDALILLCEPCLAEKTVEVLSKFAIVDDVQFAIEHGPVHRVWSEAETVWTAPPIFSPTPTPVASASEVEMRRIEAGLPRYGVDISEENFPFETPLERHVDYKKGCFIGQEPVARVHARGSGQKRLSGLKAAGPAPLPVGEAVVHPQKPKAGRVTSAVISDSYGSVALAFIHRDAWEVGTEVTVAGQRATVCALPFEA